MPKVSESLQLSRIRVAELQGQLYRTIEGYVAIHEDTTYEELTLALAGVLERQLQHLHEAACEADDALKI